MANAYCSSTGTSITESEPGWLGIPHLSLIIDDDNVEALKGFLQQKPDCPGWRIYHYEPNWHSGWGPVDYAIKTGSLNVFCELLTLEETLTAATPAHPYRLHEACRLGRLDMVRHLLNRSADVQDSLERIDDLGATPLLAATGFLGYPGSEAVMQLLLDAGANPLQDIYTAGRWRDGSDEPVEESRRQQGIDLPFLVANALTAAIEFATPALIDRLFHAGVDLCAGGSYRIEGWPRDEILIHVTPLHLACSESSVERVRALLRLGDSDAPRMIVQRDSMGRTAFHWAVLGNLNSPYVGQDPGKVHDRMLLQRNKCIQALCAHGREAATVNAQDRDGKTAMHLAVESCFPEAVICLLEQNADPNLTDSTGRTAIMALTMSSRIARMHKHVIDALAKAMVNNLSAGDGHGNTALHLACSHYRRLWIARLLIEHGAPCHLTNGSGELPLHKAAACLWPPSDSFSKFDIFRDVLRSQDQFISLLLERTRGVCDMDSKDASGKTATDILVETRLKVSNHVKQQEKGKAYVRLQQVDHAQIRAGFKIMPHEIQEVVETESGVWGLRDIGDPMALSSVWHRFRGRGGLNRGGRGGSTGARPALLRIPRHRRRISLETYGS
ncbi:hypothetical protein PFICI_12408 [Pestalotiopsis fici W106-1]|uniref:Uncharacterized protein n=1 Tax=Pestalotiopsis fici (strain W106-1 / CGMCC3.15140) TaxID=1229662 RepID=W3WNU3_PESFW|nr:uncharacterized protein PFICI_12408 [Pestalotiopsis fici W106-1]ETS75464.1 hypothetical protein PFICI_12408 [Pestalotiopsis fici W106-1]